MADDEGRTEEEQTDDEVADEVPTTFATKGSGRSGPEKDDLDVVLDR